jgi:hypothetical protein
MVATKLSNEQAELRLSICAHEPAARGDCAGIARSSHGIPIPAVTVQLDVKRMLYRFMQSMSSTG